MAANALRLRRSFAFTFSILNHPRNFSSVLPSVAPPHASPSTSQQNPSQFDFTRSKPTSLAFKFISSRNISSRARYNNDDMDGDQISPDAILFEGCDYNHWLITMDFPKDPKPSREEMIETYVQTAAKVLGSVEEAKKKIYACSTTTYNGFQVEVSEEVSEQFKGLPGVVFVLPDSYIDPVNKEYGGDKYINGTIIPRPPPVQYGRQSGRYNDRNRDYNRPPRGNAPGGQGIYQGDGRGPMPSYQANYNQGDGRNVNHARQTDLPQGDQGNFAQSEQRGFRGEGRNFTPPPVGGDYSQGGGGSYSQGTGGQYGQGRGRSYGQGTGGQYGQGGGSTYGQGGNGNYGQGGGGNFGQGGSGNFGQGGSGNYGQGGSGNYGQGVGGNYRQGGSGIYGQGGSGNNGQGGSGNYGQSGGGNYSQGMGGQYGQVSGGNVGQQGGGQYGHMGDGNYGQRAGGQYGQGAGYGNNQTSPQYGENSNLNSLHVDNRSNIHGQQGSYEVGEEADVIKGR